MDLPLPMEPVSMVLMLAMVAGEEEVTMPISLWGQ
jgi:hypothetical protein